MPRKMLVAGLGNIFFSDDGFGVEVAQRLADEPHPDWVRVIDFGIRGLHLVYEFSRALTTLPYWWTQPRTEALPEPCI